MNSNESQMELGEDYADIRESVAKLCAGFPGEYWRKLEDGRAYPSEFVGALTASGFLGALIPENYGGAGLPLRAASVILETIHASGCSAGACHAQMYIMGTLLRHGSDAQKQEFLPRIASGELRLQAFGVTEPTTGSDTTQLKTRAVRDGDHYVVNGQKIWTSLAHISDWIFVVSRSEEGSKGPKGLTFLMMEIDQPGIEIRPIKQINGDAEFNETFFTDAKCPADSLIGAVGDGWKIAMGLLAFERGVSTLGQQMGFRNELDEVIAAAKATGAASPAKFL